MTQATSSGRNLAFVKESTFAQTPATPEFTTLRTTGGALNLRKANRTSNEIRDDRQITDLIYGAERVEGELAFEYSHSSFDTLIAAAFMGEWDTNTLKPGKTLSTFSMEEFHTDNGVRLISRGCSVNTMSLSITTDEVTGSFGILGKKQESLSSEITGATYPDVSTTATMDGLKGSFKLGGSSTGIVTQLDVNIANGHEARNALGGADIEPRTGKCNVTGTITLFFETLTEYTKFINGESSSVEATLTDGTNTNRLYIPRLKYTEPDRPVSGDADIILSLPFQAIYDTTEETNIIFER